MVDDNELTRGAFAAALMACPEIELVAAVDHNTALDWDANRWGEMDVAMVDAADETRDGNQFPGVNVVKRIRRTGSTIARPFVIVVTGHFFNDGLRHLMAHAGADLFFERSQLRQPHQLVDTVLRPEIYQHGVPKVSDRGQMRRLGITERTRVDELVAYVDDHGLSVAFVGAGSKRDKPRSRTWLHHRQAMSEVSKLETRNLTTGLSPSGNQTCPSLHQLRAIYRWATRIRNSR